MLLQVKTIPLTNSLDVAIVDDKDHPLVVGYSWHYKKSACVSYVSASKRIGSQVITIRLHSLIMNPPKGYDES